MTLSANQSSKTESTDLKNDSVKHGQEGEGQKVGNRCCTKLHVILDCEAK